MTYGEDLRTRFEGCPNALDLVRLLLASAVVVWHGHLLPGHEELWRPAGQLLEQLPVDAFFALSGFLIVRSWVCNPSWRRFVAARFLRLFPGLWACLSLSAFVVVPTALALAGRDPVALRDQVDYVLGNATMLTWQDAQLLADVTQGQHRGELNISLWTLRWELLCYMGVLVLGSVGALSVRVLVAVAATSWSLAVSWMLLAVPDDSIYGFFPMPRLILMFALGGLAYLLADRIPVRASWAALAAAWTGVAALTPDYRVFSAPALVYLVLWSGLALGRFSACRLRHDLSYGVYLNGAPVQQAVLIAGAGGTWLGFTTVSFLLIVPVAAASWFLVERPAMRRWRLAAPRTRATSRTAPPSAGDGGRPGDVRPAEEVCSLGVLVTPGGDDRHKDRRAAPVEHHRHDTGPQAGESRTRPTPPPRP